MLNIFASVALVAGLVWTSPQPVRRDVPGIVNFNQVDAVVACAGATDVKALAELKRRGFRSVVNFRLPTEAGADVDASRAEAERLGLRYFHLPFDTSHPDPSVPERFVAIVTDRENQPVFVHCARGVRAAGMLMIKRVVADRWTLEDAEREARAIGLTDASPMWTFVHEYLKQKQTTSR